MSSQHWRSAESPYKDLSQRKREKEIDDRLKLLEFRQTDLHRQKDSVDLLRARLPKVLRTELPSEELRMLYELSQEEIRELKSSLLLAEKTQAEQSRAQQTLQERNLRLDLLCRQLNASIAEKDSQIARYLSEMVELRTKFEDMANKAEIQKFLEAFDASIDSIQLDESVGQWSLMHERQDSEDKTKRIAELEAELVARSQDADVRRLERQLAETQDLYALACAQLKDKDEKLSGQSVTHTQAELHSIRLQLQEAQTQHSVLSAKLLKHATEREYQARSGTLELEALQRKQAEHAEEMRQLEGRYDGCVQELETSLRASREKVLQLHEDKVRIEKELAAKTLEVKELTAAQQVRDIKASELNARLQEHIRELASCQHDLDRWQKAASDAEAAKRGALAELSRAKDRIAQLERELAEMDEKIRLEPQKPLQDDTALKAVRQLSSMILSRDRTVDSSAISQIRSALGEDFSRLMDSHQVELKSMESQIEQQREFSRSRILKEVELYLKIQDYSELILLLYDLCQQTHFEELGEMLRSSVDEVTSTLENAYLETLSLQQEYQQGSESEECDTPVAETKKRNLTQENSVLLHLVSVLRQKPRVSSGFDEVAPMLQCAAAALEDLLG